MRGEQKVRVEDFIPFDPKKPHDPTRVSHKDQDSVVWECNTRFAITRLDLDPPNPIPPANPFSRPLPFHGVQGNGSKFRAQSGPAIEGAKGFTYKTTIAVFDNPAQPTPIDPDIIIGD